MAEGQILQDAVSVRWSKESGLPQRPSTFWPFALQQMPSTRAVEEYLSARGDLKPFGHGFARLNAFGASHMVSLSSVAVLSWPGGGASCSQFLPG
jgi:hypothetical protein